MVVAVVEAVDGDASNSLWRNNATNVDVVTWRILIVQDKSYVDAITLLSCYKNDNQVFILLSGVDYMDPLHHWDIVAVLQ